MDFTPLIVAFIFYGVPISFILWFMISVISALREKNKLLREIISKLEKEKNNKTF